MSTYKTLTDLPVAAWPEAGAIKRAEVSKPAAPIEHPSWVSNYLTNGAPEGQRNDVAVRLAGYFRSLNIPQDIALASLMGFARSCVPPMDEAELRLVVASAWRYTPSRPATYQGNTIPEPMMDSASETKRRFMWPETGIEVALDHLRVKDDGIHCWLTISRKPMEYGPIRINLLSESARDGLRRALKDRFEYDWQAVIDYVARYTVRSFDTASPRIDLAAHSPSVTSPWLVYPFIRARQPSVIYADGGTGKSTLAMALALSLITGASVVPGIKVETPAPVIYGDWEDDEDNSAEILHFLARAAGLVIPRGMFHYRRFSGPLPEHTDTLLTDVAETGAKLLIVDSAIAAAGDDAHGPDAPRMHYNALRQVGEASLTLTHVPSQSDRMYGNVMWRNLARIAWLMEAKPDTGHTSSTIALYQRKGNRGMVGDTFGLQVSFEPQNIRYEKAVVADTPEFAAKLSNADRILHVLRDGPSNPKDIAEETGLDEDVVRVTLNTKRYKEKLWTKIPSGQWALVAHPPEERNALRSALRNAPSSYGREGAALHPEKTEKGITETEERNDDRPWSER